MKLFITVTSPYARIARIIGLEKGLETKVETVLAETRRADSPYYEDQSLREGALSGTG